MGIQGLGQLFQDLNTSEKESLSLYIFMQINNVAGREKERTMRCVLHLSPKFYNNVSYSLT